MSYVQLSEEGFQVVCPLGLWSRAALHWWLTVLRCQHLSAETKLLVLRPRIAPCMSYGMELWRPSKRGDNMTAMLVRAAKLISGICKQLPRPLLHCTHAMTHVRLSLTSNCLLHMHRITWELLLEMVCTPGMAVTASHARAMTRRYHTVFTWRLQ